MRRPIARLAESVCVFDERPRAVGPAERADRQRRFRSRRAPDAGAARRLHAAADVPVHQPPRLAAFHPVRRAPPPAGLRKPDARAWRTRPTGSAAISAAAARCGRSPCCWRNYENVRLVFIAPDHPKLAMRDDLRERLAARNVEFYEVDSLEEPLDGRPLIEQLDALYMTRMQREHDTADDAERYAAIDFSTLLPDTGPGGADEGVRADPAPVPPRPALRRDSARDRRRPAGDVLPPGPQRHVGPRGATWRISSTSTAT